MAGFFSLRGNSDIQRYPRPSSTGTLSILSGLSGKRTTTWCATQRRFLPVQPVQGGEGKLVAKLTFVNGAVKWAFIEKDWAVLLS
jgi:hypothetical protein